MTDLRTDTPTGSSATPTDLRRRAIELYQTTNLTVAAIAVDVGVSRDTVYRWLRREGVSLGRNAHIDTPGATTEDLTRIRDDISELRREHRMLIAQIGRMEGLIEALVGLRQQIA